MCSHVSTIKFLYLCSRGHCFTLLCFSAFSCILVLHKPCYPALFFRGQGKHLWCVHSSLLLSCHPFSPPVLDSLVGLVYISVQFGVESFLSHPFWFSCHCSALMRPSKNTPNSVSCIWAQMLNLSFERDFISRTTGQTDARTTESLPLATTIAKWRHQRHSSYSFVSLFHKFRGGEGYLTYRLVRTV